MIGYTGRNQTTDKIAHFGGEEFVVLLRETDELVAAKMADRLKRKIAALKVASGDQTVKIKTSVGCAVSDERSRDVEDIIQRADKALYTAKSAGRNRVRVYRESSIDSAAA
jgi:diguanylate cyclase (GGDEF)-like protein